MCTTMLTLFFGTEKYFSCSQEFVSYFYNYNNNLYNRI